MAHQPVQHPVQGAHRPPAVHVRIAQAQRALAQDPAVEAIVVDRRIGLRRAAGMDAGRFQQGCHALSQWMHPALLAYRKRSRYSPAISGDRIADGTSTTCTPAEYGPTW